MKIGGVSEREGMDALFFKAVDRAIGNSGDFRTVLSVNQKKSETADDFGVNQSTASQSGKGGVNAGKAGQTERNAKADMSGMNDKAASAGTEKVSNKDNGARVKDGNVKAPSAENVQETEISAETVEVLQTAIIAVVSEILDMEPYEVETLLVEKEISPLELLEPESLMELLLATSETGDITELLTNEDLAGRLKSMEDALGQLDFELYGTTKEQVEALLSGEITVTEKTEAAVLGDLAEAPISKTEEKAQKKEPVTVKEADVKPDNAKEPEEKIQVVDLRDKAEGSQTGQGKESTEGKEEQGRETTDSVKESHSGSENHPEPGVTEQFVNQLAAASTQSEYTLDSVQQTVIMYREIVDQIVQQIRVVINQDQTSMNMQLNPEHLGKVFVNMTTKNGVVTASFVVQNEIAKEAIEANLEVFKQNLNEQGTKVEAVEVDVADFGFDQKDSNEEAKRQDENQKESRSQRGRQLKLSELTDSEEDLSDEEQAAVSRMLQTGSTVEYTA